MWLEKYVEMQFEKGGSRRCRIICLVNKKYSTKIALALHSTAALNKCIILKIEQNYVLCVHFGLKF